MAVYDIVTYPDSRLRVRTKPIAEITPQLQVIIDNMFETMYAAKGVGLAATQVGLDMQLAVIDVQDGQNKPFVLINPEIIKTEGLLKMQEGCLSLPGVYDHVKRATYVKMRALDRDGKPYEIEGEDLLAECIQHEIDHLHGKLYIDHLSALGASRVKKKLKKMSRFNKQKHKEE